MNRTLTLNESIYDWLQAETEQRGLSSIEELLEMWQAEDRALPQRRETVERIKAFHQELHEKYGEMPDSVDLIREDRER